MLRVPAISPPKNLKIFSSGREKKNSNKQAGFEPMTISLVPRPHPQKEGKGLAHFEPFLVFADSTVQDPGLPIRLQACDFIM